MGPAGSHFGLLACSFVELLNAWPLLRSPNVALLKLILLTLILFVLGLVPWVDNYAHLGGFLFGALLSYALLPFLYYGEYQRRRKLILIAVCLCSLFMLLVLLFLLFYLFPFDDYEVFKYLTCLPFLDHLCKDFNITLDPLPDSVLWLPYVTIFCDLLLIFRWKSMAGAETAFSSNHKTSLFQDFFQVLISVNFPWSIQKHVAGLF